MEELINKIFLIGISFYDKEESLIEQYQTHGVLIKIENNIMCFLREDKSHYYLPFDENSIQVAKSGLYREHSTGKEIENPDFITQWLVEGIVDQKNIVEYKEVGFKPENWIKD